MPWKSNGEKYFTGKLALVSLLDLQQRKNNKQSSNKINTHPVCLPAPNPLTLSVFLLDFLIIQWDKVWPNSQKQQRYYFLKCLSGLFWRRAWQPTPVGDSLLPGESHGQGALAGYSPRGPQKMDRTV